MKKFILCFFILLAVSGLLMADDITFEATVNSAQISLDEVMQLTLTFTGVSDNLDPVSLPVIDGFSTKYMGPSTSTSLVIVNGKSESHSERSFIYDLFPNKAGKFQIPAISATISGQTYRTQPIDIEVFSSSAQAQASNNGTANAADQSQAPTEESLKDKVLLTDAVDNAEVYLNERVHLKIKLLVNGIPIRDIQYPQFDKTGVLVDDFDKPQQSTEVINGVKYDTVEFETNIYPDHLGDLTLGPVEIQGNVLYKTRSENPFNQGNDPFGGDVFNGLFDSYASRPITVTSGPIHLHVSSLPEDNRPQDFSGGIGQFDFQASVSPTKLKAGDPLTLKMDLKGAGNFKDLKMPEFQADGFKTYAPQIKGTSDEKTVEEVIIPTSIGIKEVPALHFTYFDTVLKDYKTITQGPFAIQVTAPSADQEFKAVGFADVSHGSATLSTNQFSFGRMIDKIQRFIRKLFGSIWFWISLGFIFVAGVTYSLWRRFQERLLNDPAFARRLKAHKEARQALAQAEAYMSAGMVKEFYALISRILRDYLANKWHQPSASLSVDEILSGLKKARVGDVQIAALKTLLEQADLVCFAGAERSSTQMKADLSQAQDLITRFERSLE